MEMPPDNLEAVGVNDLLVAVTVDESDVAFTAEQYTLYLLLLLSPPFSFPSAAASTSSSATCWSEVSFPVPQFSSPWPSSSTYLLAL